MYNENLNIRCAVGAGLVYNVAEYLSSLGINIESLETYTQEVSFSVVILLEHGWTEVTLRMFYVHGLL